MDELMKCSICLSRFNDPRLLQCQHTFCRSPCLEGLYESDIHRIRCPMCRQCCFMPSLNSLPRNLTLVSVMDMPTEEVVCEQCGKSDNGGRCGCCKKDLCSLCRYDHTLKIRKSLEELVQALNNKLDAKKQKFNEITTREVEHRTQENQLQQQIEDTFEILRKVIFQRKSHLIEQAKLKYEPTMSRINAAKTMTQIDMAVISSSICSIQMSLDQGTISQIQLIQLKNSIQSSLPEGRFTDGDNMLALQETDRIQFQSNTDELVNEIAMFGKLAPVTADESVLGSNDLAQSSINSFKSQLSMRFERGTVTNSSNRINNGATLFDEVTISRETIRSISVPTRPVTFNTSICIRRSAQDVYRQKNMPYIAVGKRGSGPSEFIWPRGISTDEVGRIYVADSSNNRIQVFSDSGEYLYTISEIVSDTNDSTSFNFLTSVHSSRTGDVLVCCDRYNNRVLILHHIPGHSTPNGADLILEIGFSLADADDEENGRINYPWSAIYDEDRELIFVCNDRNIQVFSSITGQFKYQINGSFGRPTYSAICPKTGYLFVSDTGNNNVQVFSREGNYLYTLNGNGTPSGSMKQPKGITIDKEGNIIVCDSGNNRIMLFDGTIGRMFGTIGSHGSEEGQFNELEGIVVTEDLRIIVTDRDNHRFQIF